MYERHSVNLSGICKRLFYPFCDIKEVFLSITCISFVTSLDPQKNKVVHHQLRLRRYIGPGQSRKFASWISYIL
jgi:hypothetical protein